MNYSNEYDFNEENKTNDRPVMLYNKRRLDYMNGGLLWNNCIRVGKKDKNDLYGLYATGDADLNGRKYVALPKGTNVKDPRIIKKYNLM